MQRDGRRKACLWCESSDMLRASSPSSEEQTQEHLLATFVLREHKFSAVAAPKIAIVTSFASCGSLVEASSLVPRFVSVFLHFRWIASSAHLLDCRHHMVAELLMTYITARSWRQACWLWRSWQEHFLYFVLTIVACVLQAVRSSRRKNSINVNFQFADDSRLEASWDTVVGTCLRVPVFTSTDGL